jgi:hypothetical protein
MQAFRSLDWCSAIAVADEAAQHCFRVRRLCTGRINGQRGTWPKRHMAHVAGNRHLPPFGERTSKAQAARNHAPATRLSESRNRADLLPVVARIPGRLLPDLYGSELSLVSVHYRLIKSVISIRRPQRRGNHGSWCCILDHGVPSGRFRACKDQWVLK